MFLGKFWLALMIVSICHVKMGRSVELLVDLISWLLLTSGHSQSVAIVYVVASREVGTEAALTVSADCAPDLQYVC